MIKIILKCINKYVYRIFRDYILYDENDSIIAVDYDHNRSFMIEYIDGRNNPPYFKVYNSIKPELYKSKVARLHFFDSNREYYLDGFNNWELTNEEIQEIKEFLCKKIIYDSMISDNKYTVWEIACYEWNREHLLFDFDKIDIDNIDKYYIGDKDFVPINTPMPNTWNLK